LTRLLRRALHVAAAVLFATVPSLACAASTTSTTSTVSTTSTTSTASVPGAPSGPAAIALKWRSVQFLPRVTVGDLAASGPQDAWLAGDVCAADSLCDHVIVRHWDGTAWRTVTLPEAATATTAEAGIGAVTASSASNAWVFDLHGTGSVDYTTALHWTGKGWAPPARLDADIDAAVAPSASDAWAFGAPASDPQAGYVAHFNGKTWSHASFPVQVESASALSARDIWVGGSVGPATGPSAVIEHWDGEAWHETPVPSLGIPPGSWTSVSVTAVTPRDAWAEVATLGNGAQSSYLLHWTGKVWARVALSCAGTAVSPVAPDGHGGVWLATSAVLADRSTAWFCHDTNGHWTKSAVPVHAGEQPGVNGLAWIPGTQSLWATGGFDADAGTAILQYGP
jgi:hypothetical protein